MEQEQNLFNLHILYHTKQQIAIFVNIVTHQVLEYTTVKFRKLGQELDSNKNT